MDGRVRLRGTREAGEAHRIRRPLIWSVTSHLLAVSSLLLLGGGAASVPSRGIVEVLLVGAPEGKRAASKGTVRAASRVPAAEAGRRTALPEAHGGSAGEMTGRVDGGPVDPSPAAEAGSFPDAPRFPHDVPASERMYRPMPGGMGEAAASGSAADGAAAGPGEMSMMPSAPGLPAGGIGPGGGTSVLRERIQSRIVYPEEAVRRGQEGDVLLRIRIGAGGVPGEIRIARSSGVRLLDAAARKGVVRAAPLPGSVGWVEVPVRFRLRQP